MWPFNRKNKIKKKPEGPRYVKICPRCHSLNIQIRGQGGLSGLTALGLPTVYRCDNCGFVAHAFPEIDLNSKKKEKQKEPTEPTEPTEEEQK